MVIMSANEELDGGLWSPEDQPLASCESRPCRSEPISTNRPAGLQLLTDRLPTRPGVGGCRYRVPRDPADQGDIFARTRREPLPRPRGCCVWAPRRPESGLQPQSHPVIALCSDRRCLTPAIEQPAPGEPAERLRSQRARSSASSLHDQHGRRATQNDQCASARASG